MLSKETQMATYNKCIHDEIMRTLELKCSRKHRHLANASSKIRVREECGLHTQIGGKELVGINMTWPHRKTFVVSHDTSAQHP